MTTKLGQSIAILVLIIPAMGYSQTSARDIPDFSNTPRKEVPAEYTWRTEDIYVNDEAWKKDKELALSLIGVVERMQGDWTTSSNKMLAMLDLYKDLNMKIERLYNYVSNQSNMDIGDTKLQGMKGEMQSLAVRAGQVFSFFNDDILKLGQEKFDAYLKQTPQISSYRFLISDILRSKDHVLPSDQQKIVSLTGLFSGTSSKVSRMLNDLEMPNADVKLSDGNTVSLNMANYMRYRASVNADDRFTVMSGFFANQKKYENTLAACLDGGIKQDWFSAQTGKFPDCLSARLYYDNIPVAVYEMLVREVKNNLSPLHRYLSLKQKLLKLNKFRYSDIYASAVPSVDKTYSYDEAKKLVMESTKIMGSDYQNALKMAFDGRWVDIYPNKGKESGAYSSGIYDVHPFIKMNYNGDYNNVSTLAHELGHAMHSFFSAREQHYITSNYATFVAEIASTFNESLLINYLIQNEKDDLFKLFLLDNYLESARGTIYRQTLFAEFELEMHRRVEEGKSLTAEWLNEKYLGLTRTYYGHDKGVCQVDDYIQSEWSRIPHFYMNYYVFQYSTGMIASMALTNMALTQGEPAVKKYFGMLKAGGSDYPITLLKNAGVDMTTPDPYKAAFQRFDQLVTEMEMIMMRLKL